MALTAPGIAFAQSADGGKTIAKADSNDNDEIVVTARRREESLQDVPVAVTALGETALRNIQAANLGDLQSSVPNLSLHVGDAQNAVVYIRGVGQVDSLAFADPGVGIYIDDVYLGRAQGAFLDVYDVARIEVLRGPQGTLYGRNTIGGAVKFVSAPLRNETEASIEFDVGNYNLISAKGSLNVPLIDDKLIIKAAFARTTRDGFSTNQVDGSDDGDKDLWAGRVALEYRPSDTVTWRVNSDISRDDPDTSRTPARATSVFGLVPPNTDPFKIDADFNDKNFLKTKGISSTLSIRPSDSVEIKSITAYRTMDYSTKLDLDGTAYAFFGVYVTEHQKQFSQELQFNYTGDRLTATGGFFYFREHDGTLSGLYAPDIELVTGSFNDQINKSYAIYGQMNYRLTETLSLTAGLRYTKEDKVFRRTQSFFDASTPFPFDYDTTPGLLVTDIDTGKGFSSVSPKFGLDFKPSDNLLLYASASRGFKSGGFDGRSNTAADAKPYLPETMWSYEVGAKASTPDHKVTANLAIFQNDYKNLQLSSFVADENNDFAALFTNAGRATMRGAELELAARPVAGLSLNANLAYLDSKYDRFIGPGGVDISNERHLVNAPKWTWMLAGNYKFDLFSFATMTLGGSISHRSKSYTVVSSSETLAQQLNTLVDAFVRFEEPTGAWWLSFGGKNLTNKHVITHGFDLSDSLGYQLAYYNDPMTYNATLGFRF